MISFIISSFPEPVATLEEANAKKPIQMGVGGSPATLCSFLSQHLSGRAVPFELQHGATYACKRKDIDVKDAVLSRRAASTRCNASVESESFAAGMYAHGDAGAKASKGGRRAAQATQHPA